ncbi:Fic family protein [Sorangium sp. So ce1099]|uniref:Fic family protein n=1 Tax=Sorangium sp. So ce1099 TaxID=3133331 RepID=UPI003F61DC0B
MASALFPGRPPPCPGCSNKRWSVRPKWESCKSERLCGRVDVTTIIQNPFRSIEYYDNIRDLVGEGALGAKTLIKSRNIPSSPGEFLELLREVHGKIFGLALPSIAGRFRRPGEEAFFGGDNRHGLRGADVALIEERLSALCFLFDVRNFHSKSKFERAKVSAIFLEKFFRIHPFVDGNGRVGRLLVMQACEIDGKVRMLRYGGTGKSRRRYLRALEYAHKHAPESEHEDRRFVRDPYRFLARWLDRHLEYVPEDAGAEAEPPSR